jgi:hypothetical protein
VNFEGCFRKSPQAAPQRFIRSTEFAQQLEVELVQTDWIRLAAWLRRSMFASIDRFRPVCHNHSICQSRMGEYSE